MEENNNPPLNSNPIAPPIQPTSSPTEAVKQKKFSFMHLTIFLCVGVITFLSLGYYLLFWSPKAQAKEYIKQSTENFMSVLDRVRHFNDDFTQLTESVEKSKEAFYEMGTGVNYEHAKTDTEQDIKDISETLELIAKAKANREEFNIPEELQSFDDKLTAYYENAENALSQLLAHQKLQMDMLNAYGDELRTQVKQVENITQISTREELIETLDKTASLAAQSAKRFRAITPIPDIEKKYYEIKLSEVEDTSITFASASSELKLETVAGDNNFAKLMTELTDRMLKGNDVLKEEFDGYIKNSNIQRLFEENNLLEKQILDDINILIREYDVEIEAPSIPSITPTIEPSATESAQETTAEEATGSADTEVSENTEESTPTAHFANDGL